MWFSSIVGFSREDISYSFCHKIFPCIRNIFPHIKRWFTTKNCMDSHPRGITRHSTGDIQHKMNNWLLTSTLRTTYDEKRVTVKSILNSKDTAGILQFVILPSISTISFGHYSHFFGKIPLEHAVYFVYWIFPQFKIYELNCQKILSILYDYRSRQAFS